MLTKLIKKLGYWFLPSLTMSKQFIKEEFSFRHNLWGTLLWASTGTCELLLLVLVLLKIFGVISLSWLCVTAPLWIPALIFFSLVLLLLAVFWGAVICLAFLIALRILGVIKE